MQKRPMKIKMALLAVPAEMLLEAGVFENQYRCMWKGVGLLSKNLTIPIILSVTENAPAVRLMKPIVTQNAKAAHASKKPVYPYLSYTFHPGCYNVLI